MVWVWLFGGIALLCLVLIVAYVVWLAHKAADVFSELQMCGNQLEQLMELLTQLDLEPLQTRV